MTKYAIWCRHTGDNIIGIGPNIPWHIKSDFQRFRRITEGQSLVAGETTYESFPNRTLPNRKIIVLTFNADYEVSDKENHSVVTNVDELADFQDDLYIVGGASVYKLFGPIKHELAPEVIIDCEYLGEINHSLEGNKVDITPCIEAMKSNYDKVYGDFMLDDINTAIWVRKDAEVEKAKIDRIIKAIEAV